MHLTKTTSHALRILIACAEADGALVKAAELSQRLKITSFNVFKLLRLLSKARFVETTRGRTGGGIRLARPANEIRIGDVVHFFESPQMQVTGAASTRDGTKQGINAVFDDALTAFISVLDQHTVADMARNSKRSQKRTTVIEARSATPKAGSARSKRPTVDDVPAQERLAMADGRSVVEASASASTMTAKGRQVSSVGRSRAPR